MVDKIICRAVIEVLGKPKEHVEKAMQEYIGNLKKDERFKINREDFAELKKQEDELWATFTELEMEVKEIKDVVSFCFEYMPSLIEIIEPDKITLTDKDFSDFFNDLQARLHQVDMIAKQVKLENEHSSMSVTKLLRNYLMMLLNERDLTLEQLSKFTGVKEELLGDYLDKLIDQKLLEMENGIYHLNKDQLIENNKKEDGGEDGSR